jgi:predicted peptidase
VEVVKDLSPGAWPGLASRYLVYLPAHYESSSHFWPLILFLHGAGERGDDPNIVKQQGLAKRLAEGADLPFIVTAPQCPTNQSWSTDSLGRLLDLVDHDYRIDSARIYVTGMSMGGRGTWSMALGFPNRFAAIAPVCGRGDPSTVGSIANLPVWAFHGALDSLVPLQRSREMVEAMRANGGEARLTIYDDADHDSWTRAYADPELYVWLLTKHRRQAPVE